MVSLKTPCAGHHDPQGDRREEQRVDVKNITVVVGIIVIGKKSHEEKYQACAAEEESEEALGNTEEHTAKRRFSAADSK
jgi:hypothetical protein